MARNLEFYKGRRKKRNYALVPSAITLGVIMLIVVLFYGMQKYAVITKDGVNVELPILSDGKTTIVVLMGAKEDSGRWEDASGLLDISFM